MKKFVMAGLVLVLSWLPAAQAQNLVANGSFEAGLTEWSINGPYVITGWYGVTDGGTALEFAYGQAGGQTLQQTIATVVGRTYTVSFDWKASHPNTSQTMDFAILGAGAGSPSLGGIAVSGGYSGPFNSGSPFMHFSTTFVADSTTATLRFHDTSRSSFNADQILDNVSMVAAPVPEPETYAMLMAGLGLLGAISRRRARR
jgi:hypothetical protein